MSDSNPYESPQNEANAVSTGADRVITEKMILYLKSAAPWTRFLGIIGFIGCGFMAAGAIGTLVGLNITPIPGMENTAISSVMFIYLLGVGALFFFPSLFKFRFGKKVQSYLKTDDPQDLEEAFRYNKSLWKFTGILYIIALGLFVLSLLIMLITGIAALAML
ncbi:MAG: hypothetical protein LBB82_07395 [Treponema sp.]|jgi:hypothetical protein|nr:hypothetical protein [Treponema sp.]